MKDCSEGDARRNPTNGDEVLITVACWVTARRRLGGSLPGSRRARLNPELDPKEKFCQIVLMEIVFSVTQEDDGGFVAECLSHDIFTQGDSWEQLRANVREAVSAYFFDEPKPSGIRLHLVRDEVLTCA